MKKQLYWLSDADWKQIEPLMPRGRRGAHRVDDRRVITRRSSGDLFFAPDDPRFDRLLVAIVCWWRTGDAGGAAQDGGSSCGEGRRYDDMVRQLQIWAS